MIHGGGEEGRVENASVNEDDDVDWTRGISRGECWIFRGEDTGRVGRGSADKDIS